VASPLPRRSGRLRRLSPEVSRPLPLRRRLNKTDPHGLRSFENTTTHIEVVNNNHFEEPQVSDGTTERDSLEQQSIGSRIREGFPPISQVIPYLIDIEDTSIQVQAPLNTPLVELPYSDFTNFRDFGQSNRTVRTFPLGQMATGNASESVPSVVTLVDTIAGSGATAS
jgi:hypothetical protein